MNFGEVNSAPINRDKNRQVNPSSNIENQGAENGFRNILQKGRLTEEDLENFRQSILKAHKKKDFKTLLITVMFLMFIGIAIYFLAF